MKIIESHKTVIFCIPERADPVESAWVSEMKEEAKMLVFTACNMKQRRESLLGVLVHSIHCRRDDGTNIFICCMKIISVQHELEVLRHHSCVIVPKRPQPEGPLVAGPKTSLLPLVTIGLRTIPFTNALFHCRMSVRASGTLSLTRKTPLDCTSTSTGSAYLIISSEAKIPTRWLSTTNRSTKLKNIAR